MRCSKTSKKLSGITGSLSDSYSDGFGVNYTNRDNLPRRSEVVSVTEKLLELLFPGFDQRFRGEVDTEELVGICFDELASQICRAFHRSGNSACCCDDGARCEEAAFMLLEQLPAIREMLKEDVKAAYVGDPAATSCDEVILSYPGLKAIAIQRLAHVLYEAKIPFIPRMMTEYAHSATGIDIHPGATIGKGFFIDHGTGVVIGETAVLGEKVRIYQGVTLGAVSFPKDACGALIKGQKRHPTIGNNVIIYSGASVLGDIMIGDNSVIGGNVWLTESLPAGTKITAAMPENRKKFNGQPK
ncbi:MAG: serine acetyltransferase [Lentisphaeria bacterium]|nr:serine acetyltransferase [Lentisphaeria bacterium]